MTERTSYRRKAVKSDAEWGSVGYTNWWGGFHRTTDTYAYTRLIWMAVRSVRHPRALRYVLHLLWDRWLHRRCDTVDFHHYDCTRDKIGKRMDNEYRWKQAWKKAN